MILRRYIFLLSLAAGALLVLADASVAQHSQPRQQRVGLYLTQVIRSDQRISRTRVLYLPPQAAAAITTKPTSSGGGHNGGDGGNKGGGSTACPTSGSGIYSVACPVAPTTSMPEAEEEIAADPDASDGPAYVAAVSDFSLRGGYNTTKWAISSDGGSTWSQQFVPLNAQNDPVTSDGMVWGANSDPDIAIYQSNNTVNPVSTVYLSDLYLGASLSAQGVLPNGIYVSSDTISHLSTTATTGNNFRNTEPVMVNTGTPTAACDPNGTVLGYTGFCLEDKPWVAVDNSGTSTPGTVYVVWDHFWSCYDLGFGSVACNSGPDIYLSYSTDGGLHWSAPILLDTGTITTATNPSLPQSGNVEGPQVAVGPNGTVYVTFEAFDPNSNTRWQYLTWSPAPTSTGGLVFNTPIVASPGFQDLNFNSGLNATSSYRVNSFPALAVGGSQEVYIEYADQVSTNSVIKIVACDITGADSASCTDTNSNPPEIVSGSNTTGQEFFPAISVDSTGVIHTSWFDTRNSPNSTADFDVYAAFNSGSVFSGVPFATAARVTPTTINTGVSTFIGDYSGIAAGPSDLTAHPVWNDFSETCGRITCKASGTMQTTTLTLP